MTTFAMEGSDQVFSCFTCGTNFPSSRGLAVHRTKKHDHPYRVPVVKVARIRTTNLKRKLCDSEDVHHEGGADAPLSNTVPALGGGVSFLCFLAFLSFFLLLCDASSKFTTLSPSVPKSVLAEEALINAWFNSSLANFFT